MDFRDSPQESALRQEIRSWLKVNLPEGWGVSVKLPVDEAENAAFRLSWERKLYSGGWSCIHWPKAYGGRGATEVE